MADEEKELGVKGWLFNDALKEMDYDIWREELRPGLVLEVLRDMDGSLILACLYDRENLDYSVVTREEEGVEAMVRGFRRDQALGKV